MKLGHNRRVGLFTCTALASTALFAGPALAQSADQKANSGLEEIIVTAQKREQSVQDVPIAVTAVTAESLKANRIFTVNDLGSIAPGLTVRPSAGGVGVPSFTIRGQNSFGVVAGSDKQVSIYLDGVYISSPRGSIFDLPDVSRLEVLRGPQGTLFGRNATAGAVSVTTRDPKGEFGAKLTGSYGNYDAYRVAASVDLPQMGDFSAYFSIMRNYKRGDIRNAGAGVVWDRSVSNSFYKKTATSPAYLGTADSWSYFAAVKYEPNDNFKMVYKFDRNDDNGTPEGTAITYYNPAFTLLGSSAALVGPLINALYTSQNIYLNPSNTRPEVVTNSWVIPREQRVQGHSLTTTWRASDSITVKNIAAFRKSRVFAVSAIDGTSSLNFTQAAVQPFAILSITSQVAAAVQASAGFGSLTPAQQGAAIQAAVTAAIPSALGPTMTALQPYVGGRMVIVGSQSSSISKQYSDELVLNYSSEKLQATLGALYFHSEDIVGPDNMQNTLQVTLPPLPASGAVPAGNQGRYFNKATSLAAYVQLEYKLSDQLTAIGGARITHDSKDNVFKWNKVVNGVISPRPDILAPYSGTKPSFLIGLNWKPNDETLVYGKWSNSFVSGGSVAGITFVPETASSFELGLKADLLDRKLRTNLALFYVDYKNYQQPASTTSPEAVAFLNAQYGTALGTELAGNLSTFVQQAHDVRAKGFELEVTAMPVSQVTMGASLAYTDTEFRNILPSFLAAQGGQYLPFVRPNWTGSAYFSFDSKPIFGNAYVNFRMDALYTSKTWITGSPDVRRAQGFPENSLATPANVVLNGRIALKEIELGGAKAEFSVWGRNLTDRNYMNSNLFLPFGTAVNYMPARTYGAELSVQF